ncbi:MAG: PhzF family phenazine biosynthesis protein [Psychrobium sp.]
MPELTYYLLDVFTSKKYGGNQLAVFIDFENSASTEQMLAIAKELNFPEITFIKSNTNNQEFEVRIFTPEYEIPFAGHPLLGTAFVISKFLVPTPKKRIALKLTHTTINIDLSAVNDIDNTLFTMTQSAPQFLATYSHQEIIDGLGIESAILDIQKPIEEITTGLPYIIIPVTNLAALNQIKLNSHAVINFLIKVNRYKSNSDTGLTTSLFFVTSETTEKANDYSGRMFCVEHENLVEDAATGSANGCFLAYLLTHDTHNISATVEQGFQMKRKSYIHLDGVFKNNQYQLRVGGQAVFLSKGRWRV